MSQLEQNTTSLDEVLAMVNALPDAGSGGGGAVETCTVKIVDDYKRIINLKYQVAFGSYEEIIADPITPAAGNYTVAAGSIVIIGYQSSDSYSAVTENMRLINNNTFFIEAGANETATFTMKRLF